MVWVGASMHSRGVVPQWAGTIQTDRGSDYHKISHTHTKAYTHHLVPGSSHRDDKPCCSRSETAKLSKRLQTLFTTQ